MSNTYTATGKALTTTANTNLIELRSSASIRCQVLEFHVYAETAVAFANPALFLTTVVGTSGTAVTGQKNDPNAPTASGSLVTGPTGGTNASVAHRRATLPAVIGTGFIWMFDRSDPLIVPLSLSLMFRNDGALGPTVSWVVVWAE